MKKFLKNILLLVIFLPSISSAASNLGDLIYDSIDQQKNTTFEYSYSIKANSFNESGVWGKKDNLQSLSYVFTWLQEKDKNNLFLESISDTSKNINYVKYKGKLENIRLSAEVLNNKWYINLSQPDSYGSSKINLLSAIDQIARYSTNNQKDKKDFLNELFDKRSDLAASNINNIDSKGYSYELNLVKLDEFYAPLLKEYQGFIKHEITSSIVTIWLDVKTNKIISFKMETQHKDYSNACSLFSDSKEDCKEILATEIVEVRSTNNLAKYNIPLKKDIAYDLRNPKDLTKLHRKESLAFSKKMEKLKVDLDKNLQSFERAIFESSTESMKDVFDEQCQEDKKISFSKFKNEYPSDYKKINSKTSKIVSDKCKSTGAYSVKIYPIDNILTKQKCIATITNKKVTTTKGCEVKNEE